jgi:hypothetical protein
LSASIQRSTAIVKASIPASAPSRAAAQTDARAIETFATSLADSGKPLLVSGATIVTPGRRATERDELIAAGPIAARIANMQAALAAAERGVRSCLVMLPRSVHGQENATASSPSSSPPPGPKASPATTATGPAAGPPST